MAQPFSFWYTLFLLVGMTVALIREWFDADVIMLTALVLMITGGIVDVEEAVSGFANEGMLTVGLLYVVACAIQKTGALHSLGEKLMGRPGVLSCNLLRLLFPVSALSAFFNNTPVVAMGIPVIRQWTKKYHQPVSKFLIPLSYAAILGGTCTLIGTSTNLVVHGMMIQNHMPGMSFFEITKIGLPVTFIGVLIVGLVGHRLLPERRETMVELGDHTREFIVSTKVHDECPFVGKSIEEAGLRHLKGLFLFQVERMNRKITPVGPREIIQSGDRLFFTGLPETIIDLQKNPGLSVTRDMPFDLMQGDAIGVYEVVISAYSPLVGKNVRKSRFRSRYDAVILAVHRSGERIRQKIGDVVLRAGDTLLVMAKNDFLDRWYHARDFYLVSRSVEWVAKPRHYTYIALGVLAAMIGAAASGLLPLFAAVSLAAVVLLLGKVITPHEARQSVDWSVLVVIASAFGISRGIVNAGVADFFARHLILFLGSFGVMGLLAGVYFSTSLYTELITNNAAAALIFPTALAVAQQADMDPRPLLLGVAVAASASFATPIGYQTNLMVYGAGGYRFRDFLKIGIPMNLFVGILVVLMLYFTFYF